MPPELSIDMLILELGDANAKLKRRIITALTESASLVEFETKRRLGHYQPGWARLSEKTVTDRVKRGFAPDRPLVRTGGLRDSYEARVDAEDLVAQIGSDSPIAVAQEMGTERIPARPVLAAVAADLGEEIAGNFMAAMMSSIGEGRSYRDGSFSSRSTRSYRSADAKIQAANVRMGNLRRAQETRARNVAARRAAKAAQEGGQ